MFEAGTNIDDYEILDTIGQGGMGIVFRAKDKRLDRIVALKFIYQKFADNPSYREKFTQEAKSAAKIDSEHVVRIWNYSEYDNLPYISYEYIEGKHLDDVAPNLSFEKKLEIALQMAEALDAAHKFNVIHRDFKPSNIMITDASKVKILDFGLARQLTLDSVDDKGDIEGSINYISPEQVSGDLQTFTTDIFSYGVVLYEMFTGKRPFTGEHQANIIYSILLEDPESPTEVNPDLPSWMDYFILSLLSKSPGDRIGSMREIIEILKSPFKKYGDSAKTPVRKKTAAIINMRNLSGDLSWNYFCKGFTEDLMQELSQRTNLIVAIKPESYEDHSIEELFKLCRTDYIITGSLKKWKDTISLYLNVYEQNDSYVIFERKYDGNSEQLFDILSKASNEVAIAFATAGVVKDAHNINRRAPDVTAYDFYLKGREYYKTNRPEDLEYAIKMFNKALSLDPQLGSAHAGLSDVYTYQYMAYHDRNTETIQKAEKEAEKAIQLDELSPDAHRALGRYHMVTGDMDNAEKALIKSIELSPKYALGYRTLAWLKNIQGDDQSALLWVRKAHALAPTDLESLLLMSLLYLDLKRYTTSMATLKRLIELGPDYGRAYYNLGIVYMKLGVFDLALENFLASVKFKDDPNSYNNTGYVYLVKKDFESAQKYFEESIKNDCMKFISYYYLGLIKRQLDNHVDALKSFRMSMAEIEECEQKDVANSIMLSYKAMALSAIGEKEKALKIIKNLTSECCHEGNILWNLARCYCMMKDKDAAEKYKNIAMKEHIGPTEKEILKDPHFVMINMC